MAVEEMRQLRLGPLFTPPSLRGTLTRPTRNGGANWGGAAFVPGRGLLVVRSSEGVWTNRVCKTDPSLPNVDVAFTYICPGGPPRGRRRLGPIPLVKPPYANLVAIDLHRGEIAWKVPFGEGSARIRSHPLLRGADLPARLGTPGNNGPMATASGLIFIGGGEPYLYAFDAATGRELSRTPTELRTSGNPMTYVGRSGRQFVVIATGGGPDAALVAFALRDE